MSDDRFFVHAGLASNDGVDWHKPIKHRIVPEKVVATQLIETVRLDAGKGQSDRWFAFTDKSIDQIAAAVRSELEHGDFWERLKRVAVTVQGKNFH